MSLFSGVSACIIFVVTLSRKYLTIACFYISTHAVAGTYYGSYFLLCFGLLLWALARLGALFCAVMFFSVRWHAYACFAMLWRALPCFDLLYEL